MCLKGKHVIVTGASRGLGLSIAREFVEQGAWVHAIGRDSKALKEAEKILLKSGETFVMLALDLCDEAAVRGFINGLKTLDVLVNNAGIARYRPLLETPTQELRDLLETNVVAPFVMIRESLKLLQKSGGGQIINIASDAAVRGIAQMAPYVASKHALLGLGRSVSKEFRKKKVRVTTFNPGPIATDIMGAGTRNPAWLNPDALAKTIVHIASLEPNVEIQELLVEPMTLEL